MCSNLSVAWRGCRILSLVTILSGCEINNFVGQPASRSAITLVAMFDLFRLWLGAVLRGFRTRRSLMLENLALRQQLAVFKRKQPRPRLGAIDKLFWVVARRFWAHWEKALVIVLPDTVVRWHRSGFKPCQSGLLSQQIDIQLAPPSSRRRLCRHHRHLLCRRLRLPLPLLPRLALVEGKYRQFPPQRLWWELWGRLF